MFRWICDPRILRSQDFSFDTVGEHMVWQPLRERRFCRSPGTDWSRATGWRWRAAGIPSARGGPMLLPAQRVLDSMSDEFERLQARFGDGDTDGSAAQA